MFNESLLRNGGSQNNLIHVYYSGTKHKVTGQHERPNIFILRENSKKILQRRCRIIKEFQKKAADILE